MAHIVLTLAEWHAVAHELRGSRDAAAPAGLSERLRSFIQDTPRAWQDQPYAIDLDAASIEAVWEVHAIVTSRPVTRDRHLERVLEAMHVIYRHHDPTDDLPTTSQEHP